MDILKDFLVNLPLLARIIAYIIGIVVWTWFIFFYPGLRHETTEKETKISVVLPTSEDKENQIKKAKIKIARMIDDGNRWLEEKIAQNKTETDKIANLFNKHGTLHSGMHIVEQIKRVNNFIKSIDDYIREIDRQVEDLLVDLKEERFEKTEWLKDEYQKYSNFITSSNKVKDSIKKQNNEMCIRFSDETTFNNILKSNPYKD